jgi:hypothetical protein
MDMSPIPAIIAGRNETGCYWHVGDHFITAYPSTRGWEARIHDRRGGPKLLIDGYFATEADATSWCRRMAAVLAEDRADD